MSGNNDNPEQKNRRDVLRKTSAIAAASPILGSTATASAEGDGLSSEANRTNDANCQLCSPTVVASAEGATLLRIPNVEIDETSVRKASNAADATQNGSHNGGQLDRKVTNIEWEIPDYDDEFLVRIDKKNRVIDGRILPTEQLDAITTNNISVSTDGIHLAGDDDLVPMESLDEYVHDYENWGEKFEVCNGVTANHHYAAGISIHTGDAWSGLTGAVLGGILCAAVPGGWLAKLGGQFIGNGTCSGFGYIIYNWIGPSTNKKFTYGMWDEHRGWGNIEHLVRGRAAHWTTTHTSLESTYNVPGVHIGRVMTFPEVLL